jgi:hypothetical protein
MENMQDMFDGATFFQQNVSSWGNGWDLTRFVPANDDIDDNEDIEDNDDDDIEDDKR